MTMNAFRKIAPGLLALLLSCSLLMFGCDDKSGTGGDKDGNDGGVTKEGGPGKDDGGGAGKEGGETKPPGDDPVWIKVNEVEIRKSEVESDMANLAREMGGTIPPELEPALKRHAMELAAQRVVLDKAVEASGIEADAELVEKEINKIKSSYPDESFFQQWLAEQGLTEAQLRGEVSKNLAYLKYFEEKVEVPEPAAEEVESFYEQFKDQMVQPAAAKVVHVFIRLLPDASEEEVKAAKKKADEVLEKAKAGEDLSALAAEYSDSPSRSSEGKETFKKGQMGEEFDKALFSLKSGDLSPVIESPAGFHVVKVIDMQEEKAPPLETVKEYIVQVLQEESKRALYPEYMKELMKGAKIEYIEPLPEVNIPGMEPDMGAPGGGDAAMDGSADSSDAPGDAGGTEDGNTAETDGAEDGDTAGDGGE